MHPTDFTDLSGIAFAHALRIALAAKSKLHLLHVAQHDTGGALAFPHVRRLLVQWGLTDEEDPPWVVATKLGIEVPVHTAVVVDEFGTFQGIVTRTDLLETVAGDLPKIDVPARPKITQREDGSYLIDAFVPVLRCDAAHRNGRGALWRLHDLGGFRPCAAT